MTSPLKVQWVACTSSSSSLELREQCARLSRVAVCRPRNAAAAIAQSIPHVVVFEFDAPDASQLQLLQTVTRLHARVPILMITSMHSEKLAVWASRSGVWNYLVTPVPLRELKSNLERLAKISRRRESSKSKIEKPGGGIPGAKLIAHTQAAMQRTLEHLRKEHTGSVRVTELARECGMTRYAFSRLFRSSVGMSCREYVVRLRIETACRMLEAPHASVAEVAIAAGFTDASYFARIFRRHMHTSPIQYVKVATRRRHSLLDFGHVFKTRAASIASWEAQ